MGVKSGYKQSEVGEIPNDWSVKKLGQLATVVRGGSPRPAGDKRYFEGSYIPWLTVASLTNISPYKIVVTETAEMLTKEGSNFSRKLSKGTLVIANSGAKTLGVSKVLAIDCCANDGIAAFLEQKDGDKRFICQYLNSRIKWLRTVVAAGNDQLNLNTARISLIPIPFPQKKEQEIIADTLGDVDCLIENLGMLIIKKKFVKKGVMQELLSGRRRLPGFDGKWQTKMLGEVVEIKKGQMITESKAVFGTIPVIAGGKSVAYFHNVANRNGKTITISGSGASAGYVAFYNTPIFASDCSTISESSEYIIEFIYNVLLLNQNLIYKSQTGGAQPHIHPSDLRPLLVAFPPTLNEQKAIAEVLNDMDTEIAKLETRLVKIQNLKQGFIQELLTGKIRLI